MKICICDPLESGIMILCAWLFASCSLNLFKSLIIIRLLQNDPRAQEPELERLLSSIVSGPEMKLEEPFDESDEEGGLVSTASSSSILLTRF